MDCSQIFPGAINPGPCSLATGYCSEIPFIVYASGKDLVILDGRLGHIQTVLGSDCGYGDTRISCVHCATFVGKIAVGWGSDVVVFEPEPLEEGSSSSEFLGRWCPAQTLTHSHTVLSLCWNREGTQLLTGGESIVLWNFESYPEIGSSDTRSVEMHEMDGSGFWKEVWQYKMALPVVHLKFSSDGTMFASAAENDCLVKIWYSSLPGSTYVSSGLQKFSFVYIAHPCAVTGIVWRKTSPFMPKGCVANVLLTYCKDRICRFWSHSLLTEKRSRFRFFISASIDPFADIPFRTTMPINNMPFLVHWLNNKEATFTNMAEKTQRGAFLPPSRHSSLASFASSINEEMLQSWVCIEDMGMGFGGAEEHSSDPASSDNTGSGSTRKQGVYSFSNFLTLASLKSVPPRSGSMSPAHHDGSGKISTSVRMFTQLMEEWNNSPDLLLCIHPFGGALMVWTVEGLDAPPNSAKLVHVSFSSCLPHMFPPHLAQSLRQELLQFLVKQPDAVTRDVADASFPVPQIRLPGGGLGSVGEGMSDLMKEDVMKSKPDSTLILVSNHLNGSLNTWSVELTANSTSIAGLIHCGGTGGHHSEVRLVHRHPWLPVLMTVSSDAASSGEESGGKGNGVESELIIWNADLPGPLEHKSSLNELSRMSSTNPLSFRYVTWVPPISVGSSRDGAFGRCPSSGLFLANVGNELLLYQTSLYSITKPQPTNLQQDNFAPSSAAQSTGHLDPSLTDSEDVTITSHLGKEGISVISVIEKDLSSFEQIVSLYAFRMCSLITSSEAKISADSKFCKDIIIALIENRIHSSSTTSPGLQITNSYLHLWRVVICSQVIEASSPITGMWEPKPPSSLGKQPVVYSAAVEKVFSKSLPLPAGVHVEHSSPACDVPSSLQLQLPTISAPFLFTTACSDGTIRCWQFTVKSQDDTPVPKAGDETRCVCEDKKEEKLEFELYEVFGAYGSHEMDMSPSASKCLDCYQEDVLKTLPLSSHIPSAISGAYPGRFAMAHLLSRPASPAKGGSAAKVTVNPLGRYAVVSVWECESSGGLKWSCEATLMLSGLGIVTTRTKSSRMNVLLEWLPMENGAYLLATCFASIISIFGMALPQAEGQFTTLGSTRMSSFLPTEKLARLTKQKSQASWVCLLQFPCAKPYPGLSISCFAYTGSNSLLYSIGSEMHLYSCWVKGSRLEAFTPSKEERKLISKTPSRVFRAGNLSKLTDDDIINLLDYAHARNTPLPQYHPKILTELMNSGKLQSVKAILVNLVKYLLLYEGKWKKEHGSIDEHEYEYEEEVESKRRRLLSVSTDGHLKRSRKVKAKISVESIPPLSLSKLGIFTAKKDTIEQQPQQEEADAADQGEDDYDELFSTTLTAPIDDFTYGFEPEGKVFTFTDLDAETTGFTPDVAQKLSSILHYAQLADLSDLEQVRLLALAETVANTKLSFSDQTGARSIQASTSYSYNTDLGFSTSGMGSGAGYATQTLSHGVIGGEAMDDCGLRYLLALENYVTLSESLPKGVSPGRLLPSEFMWAFHSDAETELLATLPCVQKDELSWEELRNVGVGWWLRSSDTLRRLIEKLAKTQFMQQQDPLDASLFYLAMKKKTLVKGLFKTVSDNRMMKFFSNDFTQERWRKAALKNAFALLSKQRFEHAAAFFLLADKLWDAAEVCVSRLGDLQLAFVITRLYEGDGGSVYERLLKEYILGVNVTSARPVEASPDAFLRSIAHWLLRDYSRSLETLLILPSRQEGKGESRAEHASNPDPAIFNFYFFLRLHPLLIRRDYDLRAAKSFLQTQPHPSKSPQAYGHPLSGVGDEPLTPAERNLLFNTSYHYLVHGCPLLALNVLSKLPKSCSLGTELCDHGSSPKNEKETLRPPAYTEGELSADNSMADMILSGTLDDFSFGGSSPPPKTAVNTTESDFDWSKPVSSKLKDTNDMDWSIGGGANTLEDEFDWSKPVSLSVGLEDDNEDIDWSQPVSNRRMSTSEPPPGITIQSPEKDEPLEEEQNGGDHKSHLSTQGLFTLSLAEQLEYNACLSILTEELNTIYIPACCQYIWEKKGKDSLPLLPLIKRSDHRNLAVHYYENTFVKTVLNLRGMLVEWLRDQTKIVKEICSFELVEDDLEEDNTPAGYDLLTTLMNYVSLHAATTPTLLTIKLELMHLMNTLLPWSTGSSQTMLQDLDVVGANMPMCAIDPAQVPILTSCSLPAKHLTNLALHLRLMSASTVETLATHSLPPIQTNPLPHIEQVFELCCAISHCINVCLSPMRPAELASSPTTPTVPGIPTQRDNRTPKGSPMLSSRTRADSFESAQNLDLPNTKASKWPGVPSWPNSLSSDEGKDPTPLSLILVECCITVYMGLLSVAWSWHSISDLLLLIQNAPSQEMWYSAFGGGVDVKKGDEKGKRSGSIMQRIGVMTKWLRTMRRTSSEAQEGPITGLFIAPKKTLLDHYLSSPSGIEEDEESIFEPSEDSTTEAEESGDYDFQMEEEGPRFRIGSVVSREEGDHNNPNSFAWCLMNVCISKLVQEAVRKILSIVGFEVLELVTASPLLYSALKVLEEWESVFTRRLDALGEAPDDLFRNEEDDMFKVGPALMRHKFILEPDNSPFRSHSKAGRQAKELWQYLVHQDTVRETFIHYIFTNKRVGSAEDPEPPCRIIYKEPDSIVSAFCFNSSNPNVLALAVGREVLEISIPDTTALDYQPEGSSLPAKRHTIAGGMAGISEDFVMIQRQKSTISRQPFGMHTQTGGSSSMLLKRYSPGTKNMATHPNLAYYLTGSIDGSVVMWEFGTPKPVSLLRNPGTAPSVTRIRFTPQGNKYGVADASGRLNLWQGIHTSTKTPYQTLTTGMFLSDFLFLGSSSFIATCGEGSDQMNLLLWDTLLPPKSSVVREYMCHDGGATTLGYSRMKQRLFCGGKKGEICIFDIRQYALLQCIPLHSSTVNCILVNDVDGYFVSGSADGDLKVMDLTTVTELASFPGEHAKSRLFRLDHGVTDMCITLDGKLYSSGTDGTIKCRNLDF